MTPHVASMMAKGHDLVAATASIGFTANMTLNSAIAVEQPSKLSEERGDHIRQGLSNIIGGLGANRGTAHL